MGHHASDHVCRLRFMAAAIATCFPRNANVTRINEAHKLPTLARQQRISAFRICAAVFSISFPFFREARLNVSRALNALDLSRFVGGLSRYGIAAVAGSTRKAESVFAILVEFFQSLGGAEFVHRLNLRVTGNATFQLGGRGCWFL